MIIDVSRRSSPTEFISGDHDHAFSSGTVRNSARSAATHLQTATCHLHRSESPLCYVIDVFLHQWDSHSDSICCYKLQIG